MSKDDTIEKIARDILGIESLAIRGRDSLDFHDLNVGLIKEALEEAYQAGQKAVSESLQAIS